MARIALDIDSTLHHYWDLLDEISRRRFGIELPYSEQRDWGITALAHEQLVAAVRETHSDENIESAEPYPGAVETVSAQIQSLHAGGYGYGGDDYYSYGGGNQQLTRK